MARTLGIVDPLDPSNPMIKPRTFDPNVASWFFEDQLLPNPLPCDWRPLPPLIEGMPLCRMPDMLVQSRPLAAVVPQGASGGLRDWIIEVASTIHRTGTRRQPAACLSEEYTCGQFPRQ